MDPLQALTIIGEAIGVILGGAHALGVLPGVGSRIRDTPGGACALGVPPSVCARILEASLDAVHVRGAPRDVGIHDLEIDRALIGDIGLGEDLTRNHLAGTVLHPGVDMSKNPLHVLLLCVNSAVARQLFRLHREEKCPPGNTPPGICNCPPGQLPPRTYKFLPSRSSAPPVIPIVSIEQPRAALHTGNQFAHPQG